MDFEKYVNPLNYPTIPQKPTVPSNFKGDAQAFREHSEILEAYEKQLNDFEKFATAFDEKTAELYAEFKVDALKEVGLWKHDAGNRAFEYSYNKGGNYNNTFYILTEIAYVILGPQ